MGFNAKATIREEFSRLPGTAPLRDSPLGYTLTPGENLIDGIPPEVLEDLAEGSGNELEGPAPKFCAVHSSSALAVNSLCPMRQEPGLFGLAGLSGFTSARFEKKLPTGLLGTPPNLDFFASGAEGSVAVESKFTEILGKKTAKFASSYDQAIDRLAEPAWRSLFTALRARPQHFIHLDAAQLVKHYLGMRHSLKDEDGEKVLLYLFWEPTNAHEIPEFQKHRAELEEFAPLVSGSEIRFEIQTHSELWSEWLEHSSWPGIEHHVSTVRSRYEIALPQSTT